MSKTVSVTVGAVAAQLLSAGLWAMMGTPAFRAAWSWECTYYTSASSVSPVYMAVNATTGPTCEDGSKLSCSCAATNCEGPVAALVNNLSCAGGGMDKAAGSCMMLHKTYGVPPAALVATAGRGMGNLTDACSKANIIKVYGNKDGFCW
ncbi:unnamed protein product [Polarella glacialis]|uniref:Post-SET domain-containing protein n=1 Tax=Polarella glacialis TaxID=89957 RepID=A0A813H7K4_POLGL|nr:unnamed protein product [Polarella glacialis]